MKMRMWFVVICTILAWALPAAAMPTAKSGDLGVSNTVMVWGHGHHHGWGRGHHYGWWRGRHRGWH